MNSNVLKFSIIRYVIRKKWTKLATITPSGTNNNQVTYLSLHKPGRLYCNLTTPFGSQLELMGHS